MLKLRRLRIDKFRSVAPGTELRFSDGFNVLLGQNGTGKTTLLELISMVVRSNFQSLAKEELAIEYELEKSGEGTLVVVIRNEQAIEQVQPPLLVGAPETFRSSAEIRGEPSSSGQQSLIRYNAETGLHVGDKPPYGPLGIPSCMDPGFLFFYLLKDLTLARFAQSVIVAGRAQRFDESLELFARITDSSGFPGELLRLARGPFIPGSFAPPLVPDAMLRKLEGMYKPTRSDYALAHQDLDFLSEIKDVMGFASAELKVDVIERHPVNGASERVKLGNLVFRFWWEGGDFITHSRLSYGQKRLLTFFYYLASNPDFVIADELVNGLHHRWIAASVEAIGQRQAFLTSQNPLLFDYLPLASPEEVRSSFVLCRSEPRDGRPGWAWENMSEEDAAELFAAHEVGIEHVSEILQSRGLW